MIWPNFNPLSHISVPPWPHLDWLFYIITYYFIPMPGSISPIIVSLSEFPPNLLVSTPTTLLAMAGLRPPGGPWVWLKLSAVTKKSALQRWSMAGRSRTALRSLILLSHVISSSFVEKIPNIESYQNHICNEFIKQYPITIPYEPIEHQLCKVWLTPHHCRRERERLHPLAGGLFGCFWNTTSYPLAMTNIALEDHHVQWVDPL